MRKNITLTSILLGLLFVFTGNAQLTEPSIKGPGITRGTYATAGENMTYSITYGSYSVTSAQRQQVRWENQGSIPNLRAYNIVTGTKVFDKTQSVYVATKELGNIVLSGPSATITNSSITINVSISPAPVGDVYVNFSGTNFTTTSSSGESVTGYFTSTGNQTITATFTGPHINTKTVTKTITVIPNTISGVDAIAYDKTATYSIPLLPSGITCTWSVSNHLQIISGQGTSTIIVKAINQGEASITASILGINLYKNIRAGVPDINKVTVSIGAGSNTLYFYHTNRNECIARYSGTGTILEYEWDSADWEVFNPQTPNYSTVYLKAKYSTTSSMANIKIRARNSVGWSSPQLIGATVNFDTSGSVYKIQAVKSGIITVSKEKSQEYSLTMNTNDNNPPIGYALYNQYTGILVKQGILNSEGGTLDFSNLPNGVYVFSLIIDSTNRQTEKILISK